MGLFSLTSTAQQPLEWDELLEELYATNDENRDAREDDYDVLADLAAHPLNLNTASREELARIPSSQQNR